MINTEFRNKRKPHVLNYLLLFLIPTILSCHFQDKKATAPKTMIGKRIYEVKPASSSSDTMEIKERAAIFFNPDSIQIEKIKSGENGYLYEPVAHDCYYQEKTAKALLERYWKEVKIVEDPHARFLLFARNDHTTVLIDLDKLNDPCGMILFDPSKNPELEDLMNAGTAMGYYFNK